ncbi:ABC transporter substrate-binding protein [Streptomyces sp. NPDC004227]
MLPENVRSAGSVDIGVTFGYAPAAYLSPGNVPTGFTIDLARELGRVLGIKVNLVSTDFNGMFPGLLSGRFNAVMGNINVTPERTKQMIMVTYANTSSGLLVAKGNPDGISDLGDLCGLKAAVLIGSTNSTAVEKASQSECVSKGRPAIKLDTYSDSAATFQAVATNRADVHLDNYIRVKYAADHSGGNLSYVKDFHYPMGQHGIGFAPGQEQLAKAFEAAVAAVIADGSYDKVHEKWNYPDWEKVKSPTLEGNAGK